MQKSEHVKELARERWLAQHARQALQALRFSILINCYSRFPDPESANGNVTSFSPGIRLCVFIFRASIFQLVFNIHLQKQVIKNFVIVTSVAVFVNVSGVEDLGTSSSNELTSR
jgi:hypothetical protein